MTDTGAISDIERDLMLAEYRTLREETLKRMDHRVTLLVTSLTVTGAILALGVERNSGPLLLITPIIAVLFGLLVLYHTKVIADIARYLVTAIEEPLRREYPGVLQWHTAPWRRHRFREILTVFHLPTMLTTVVPAVTALTLCWQFGGPAGVMAPLAMLDAALVAFYVIQYLRRITQPLVAAAKANATTDPA